MRSWLFVLLALAVAPHGESYAGPPRPARTGTPAVPGGLTFEELVALARGAGFGLHADLAARIAWRESRGNPRAVNIVTSPRPGNLPERSFGLWQINTLASPQYSEASLLDPAYNARAAFELARGGIDFRPWRVSP